MGTIFTVKRDATNHIGVRVVAHDDHGRLAVELWDYNASPGTNFTRAAEQLADGGKVEPTAMDGDNAMIFRTA